jgi:large subunit ribosomal protein L3
MAFLLANTILNVQVKTPEVDGYCALQIGAFDCPAKNVTKPLLFHFQAAGVAPKRVLKEFPVTQDALLPVGTAASV